MSNPQNVVIVCVYRHRHGTEPDCTQRFFGRDLEHAEERRDDWEKKHKEWIRISQT